MSENDTSPDSQSQQPSSAPERQRRNAHERHVWEYRWVRDLLIIAAVVLAIWAAYKASVVTVPVLLGLALAYVVNPLVTWAERRLRIPRWTSTAAIICIFVLCVAGLLAYVLPKMLDQAYDFQENGRQYLIRIAERLDIDEELLKKRLNRTWREVIGQPVEAGLNDNPHMEGSTNPATDEPSPSPHDGASTPANSTGDATPASAPVTDEPAIAGNNGQSPDANTTDDQPQQSKPSTASRGQDHLGTLISLLFRGVGGVIVWLKSTIESLFGLIIYVTLLVVLVTICFFYFTWKFDPTIKWFEQFIPSKYREQTLDIVNKMDRAVSQWLRGRLIQSLVVATILCVGWGALGVNYWLLLGLAGGLLNLIPYASGLVWPVAVFIAWAETITTGQSFSWWWVVIGPTLVYVVAQLLDGWVIEPLVQGSATELNALAVLLAVMVGASLAGFFGMLLAIPVCACLKIVMQEAVLPQVRAYLKRVG